MEELKLNIDGINIAFLRRGRGVALVLLHGYPLDHTIWNGTVDMLSAEFDVVVPDLRGFGESDVMEADRSIIEYASDVAGLLERLHVRHANIVGHSMGGYVALAMAREYPEMVSGLGLVSSQAVADTADRKAARQESARQVLAEGVGGVAEGMTDKLSRDPHVRTVVRAIIERQRPLALAIALDAMAGRPDATDVLRSFKSPVVIIHGDADELISVERAREMKVILNSAHYLELPGAGHLPMMENPAAVAEALRFLNAKQEKSVRILDP